MYRKKLLIGLFSIFSFSHVPAQDEAAVREYISKYRDIAIAEMQRTGVPASIKLAQGIHETFAGQSELVIKSKNHFGIKCKTGWQGESVKHTDDAPNECFRKYSSAADSYRDHSDFLRGSDRYAFLFRLNPTDYSGWAYGLKKAGYATNPKYAPVIIRLIEEYDLQDYTLIAMGKMNAAEKDIAKNNETVLPVELKQPAEELKTSGPQVTKSKSEEIAQVVLQDKPLFPEGEFKINETKVVFVKKGTSFLSLATQYNIPLARIFEFNDLPELEATEKDQLIYLMRKRKTGNEDFHIVKSGESLHDIAQLQAIRIESLLEYNYLSASQKPAAGETLYLKTKAPAAPKLVSKENAASINKLQPALKQTGSGWFSI